MKLELDNKSITFTPEVFRNEEGDELIIEANLGENKDIWKSTFFPDIPEKELYKQSKVLDQLYAQLEEKLTAYVKETYPELIIDWDTVRYDELFLMDNNFKMTVMYNA